MILLIKLQETSAIQNDTHPMGSASEKGNGNGEGGTHLALEKLDELTISPRYEPLSDAPEALDGVKSKVTETFHQTEELLKDRQDRIVELAAKTYSDAGDGQVEHKVRVQAVHANGKSLSTISEGLDAALNHVSATQP